MLPFHVYFFLRQIKKPGKSSRKGVGVDFMGRTWADDCYGFFLLDFTGFFDLRGSELEDSQRFSEEDIEGIRGDVVFFSSPAMIVPRASITNLHCRCLPLSVAIDHLRIPQKMLRDASRMSRPLLVRRSNGKNQPGGLYWSFVSSLEKRIDEDASDASDASHAVEVAEQWTVRQQRHWSVSA